MKLVMRAAALLGLAAVLPACGGAFGGFYVPFPNTVAGVLLRGSQVVPALGTGASGTATITVDGLSKFIDYTIDTTGLVTVTAIEIRLGVPGTNGPVMFTLPLGAFPLSGRLEAANLIGQTGAPTFPDACNQVANGNAYLLVSTALQPAGEIRGHIGNCGLASASLTGGQENPPLALAGTGTTTVSLNDAQDEFTVNVNVSGVTGVTGAQIFDGNPAINGSAPLFSVTASAFTSSAVAVLNAGDFTPSATITTFPDAVNALLSGGLYVQVLTGVHPAGEIRGQIGPTQLNAVLTSADVAPSNTSTATGSATLAFNATQTSLFILLTHTVIAPDRAGINVEAAGLNGPKIFDLVAIAGAATSPLNATGTSGNLIKNSGQNIQSFADAVNAILIKRSYVDVGDLSFPGGEIRGQFLP
jgi:hypothetical protein